MPRRRIHLPVAMGLAWGLQGFPNRNSADGSY